VPSRLVVLAGKQLTIDHRYPNPLVIDELIMEDNSRIDIEQDLEMQVTQNVSIGTGCLIEANGLRGLDGSNAVGVPPQAPQLTPGTTGFPGGDGKPGGRGKNLRFTWAIQTIGDCIVCSNGGAGGNAGNGAPGGQGGGATCLGGDGRPGGQGGPGGRGGRGGDSGKIEVVWFRAAVVPLLAATLEAELGITGFTSTSGLAAVPLGLRLEANAGNGGRGGLGALGGRGGDGVDCGFYGKGGGPNGVKGPDGRDGGNGERTQPRSRIS
jgi:hypothetical protein